MDSFTNGYSCGTGHFSVQLDAIFIGMEGVTGIADDMIIAGKDKMEHDRNFLAFMEKCTENNLTLNAEKIQFKQKQVSFYGHVWSDQGISPDPKKIQALKHMEFPPDKETMRSFLGMITTSTGTLCSVHTLQHHSIDSHTRQLITSQEKYIWKTSND